MQEKKKWREKEKGIEMGTNKLRKSERARQQDKVRKREMKEPKT